MEELKEENECYQIFNAGYYNFFLPSYFQEIHTLYSYRDEEGTGMDQLKNWRKVSGLHLDSSGSPKKTNSEEDLYSGDGEQLDVQPITVSVRN